MSKLTDTRWLTYAAGTAALALIYFTTARLGLRLGVVEQVTAVWLPAGIALSAVLLAGRAAVPGIALGALAANLMANETAATACAIAIGNSLEALAGAWLLRHATGLDRSMSRLRHMVRLAFVAAPVGSAIAATIGVTSLCVSGIHGWGQFSWLWGVWWLGDSVGMLLVTPLVLMLSTRWGRAAIRERMPEAALLIVGEALASFIVFSKFSKLNTDYPLEYAVFPFIIWAGLRFSPGMTALVGMVASAIAVWGTSNGLGTLARWPDSEHAGLVLLQVFIGVFVVTGLLLSATITEHRLAEESRQRQHGLLDAIVQGTSDAVFVKDRLGRYLMINPAGARLVGTPAEQVLGLDDREFFSPETARSIMERDQAVMASGATQTFEEIGSAAGMTRTYLSTKGPYRDDQGRVIGLIGISRDVTERLRGEKSARFLADAGAVLAALVDPASTLQKVARLAVPAFADWCVVDIVQPDGALRRVAVAHDDPRKIELGFELAQRYPADPKLGYGPPHVLRTGQSELVHVTDEILTQAARNEEHLQILRELGLRSYILVPVRVRDRNIGVIAFVTAESGNHYDKTDLAVAEELARRASIALENAQLYSELREADRRKNEFLATLAHELRNPLAPIRNALMVMSMPEANGEALTRAKEMMGRQVQQLVRLVDDLLDVSRIMQGKIELRKERTELAAIINRAVETAQPVIEAAEHQLTVSLPPSPVWLNADTVRLSQVIGNLLNNAAKYTERGGKIWLTACLEADELVLRVRDTGVGIAAEMLPQVFELFVQADRSRDRSQGGMGIGLTLVKSLAEIHGGRVEAHSEGRGKGSEFIVRVPARVDASDVVGARQQPTGPTESRGRRRILVVDDNLDAADSLAMWLRLQGHDVQIAHDGATAIGAAAAEPPALAFLDLGMPGMDGYEVARRFRLEPQLQNVMLVALTGWGQEEDRRQTQEAGFDYHLTKPADPEELQRLLAMAPGE